jgi:phage gp36-like protein
MSRLIVLTKAKSLDDAKIEVDDKINNGYLNPVETFVHITQDINCSIHPVVTGNLSESSIYKEIIANRIDPDSKQRELMASAQMAKSHSLYGLLLFRAGALILEKVCLEATIYNLETGDYSIPGNHLHEYYAVTVYIKFH